MTIDLEDNVRAIRRYAEAVWLLSENDNCFSDKGMQAALVQLSESIQDRCARIMGEKERGR